MRSALVLVQNLTPGGLGLFLQRGNGVDAAAGEQNPGEQHATRAGHTARSRPRQSQHDILLEMPKSPSKTGVLRACPRSKGFHRRHGARLRYQRRTHRGPKDHRPRRPIARRNAGVWPGELGQTQFLPSSYLKFAVDYDGNARRDLIRSAPNVLASTALDRRFRQLPGVARMEQEPSLFEDGGQFRQHAWRRLARICASDAWSCRDRGARPEACVKSLMDGPEC